MLCPRCNSENDLGERFCKFCGAPLTDSVSTPQSEPQQKKQKPFKHPKAPKEPKPKRVSKRTYSLNESAYKRDHVGSLISIFKSVLILLVLIVLIYFIVTTILVKNANTTDTYSIGGDKIASLKYVLGDRELYKVRFGFDDGVLTKTYYVRNMKNMSDDLIKYVAYLIENYKYTVEGDFDITQSKGSTKLIAKSEKAYANMDVIEISWNGQDCALKMYRDLESNVKKASK